MEKMIVESVKENNIDKIIESVIELQEFLGKYNFFKNQLEEINKLNIPFEIKMKYYMIVSMLGDSNPKISKSFIREFIPEFFEGELRKHIDEFIELIKNDEELQILYCKYFRKNLPMMESLNDKYEMIFKLPKFKEIVLNDIDFISKRLSNKIDFFEKLPEDYGYLISLYDMKNIVLRKNLNEIEKIYKIYNKFYKNILSEDQQLELLKVQISIGKSLNILELEIKDRVGPLMYVLEKILNDKSYFEKMSVICDKAKLDLKTIIWFASKYDNTPLFDELVELPLNYETKLVEKIEYLANNGKIKDFEKIKNIQLVSLEELKLLPKFDKSEFKLNLNGGPHSRTKDRVFLDSSPREIRRIDANGDDKILIVSLLENHENVVKEIYRDVIKFPDDCKMAVERGILAAKLLMSITFIIENEMCLIVTPNDISECQLEKIKTWFENANYKSVIGIILYDRKNDVSILVDDGNELDKNMAINYISSFVDSDRKKTH